MRLLKVIVALTLLTQYSFAVKTASFKKELTEFIGAELTYLLDLLDGPTVLPDSIFGQPQKQKSAWSYLSMASVRYGILSGEKSIGSHDILSYVLKPDIHYAKEGVTFTQLNTARTLMHLSEFTNSNFLIQIF